MRTGVLVAALTASGVVGGLVAALLARGPSSPEAPGAAAETPRETGSAEDLAREVDSLRARLDEMQSSVAASADRAERLRADLEAERKAAAETRTRLEGMEAARSAAPPVALGDRLGLLAGGEGNAVRFALPAGHADRMAKVAELRQKNEDERWAAARDALSLTAGQEEELKAAIKERGEALRDALRVETKEAAGEGEVTVRVPDVEKMREARRRYDDRVNAALSQDQAKRWRDEGYEGALGGGGLQVTSAVLVEGGR
jgi:hypothetical protein